MRSGLFSYFHINQIWCLQIVYPPAETDRYYNIVVIVEISLDLCFKLTFFTVTRTLTQLDLLKQSAGGLCGVMAVTIQSVYICLI